MKCCGEDRTTPFCPTCGKQLGSAGNLNSLMRHIRKQVDRLKGTEPRRGNFVGNSQIKWECWAEALEAMIARDAERSEQSD